MKFASRKLAARLELFLAVMWWSQARQVMGDAK